MHPLPLRFTNGSGGLLPTPRPWVPPTLERRPSAHLITPPGFSGGSINCERRSQASRLLASVLPTREDFLDNFGYGPVFEKELKQYESRFVE